PTHQPVEHYWALRIIPNLDFVRPCDALECAMAWAHALERKHGPTALALSRQKLANIPRPAGFDNRVMLKGAYVLAEAEGERVRLVSAPCWDLFERQDAAYRDSVLPVGVRRAVVEIGITEPWRGVVGPGGVVVGHDGYGASAPDKVLQKEFGFTPEAVAAKLRKR